MSSLTKEEEAQLTLHTQKALSLKRNRNEDFFGVKETLALEYPESMKRQRNSQEDDASQEQPTMMIMDDFDNMAEEAGLNLSQRSHEHC